MNASATRILGIDPGLQRTGWGVVEASGNRLVFVASGTVRSTAAAGLAVRLRQRYEGLAAVIEEFAPHEAAVETTFVSHDGAATLKLGQARGVALLSASLGGLDVAEYAPNAVKKSVVGAGHADKSQIQMMVKTLMPRATFNTADAADALAVAICHAHHRGANDLASRIARA